MYPHKRATLAPQGSCSIKTPVAWQPKLQHAVLKHSSQLCLSTLALMNLPGGTSVIGATWGTTPDSGAIQQDPALDCVRSIVMFIPSTCKMPPYFVTKAQAR